MHFVWHADGPVLAGDAVQGVTLEAVGVAGALALCGHARHVEVVGPDVEPFAAAPFDGVAQSGRDVALGARHFGVRRGLPGEAGRLGGFTGHAIPWRTGGPHGDHEYDGQHGDEAHDDKRGDPRRAVPHPGLQPVSVTAFRQATHPPRLQSLARRR